MSERVNLTGVMCAHNATHTGYHGNTMRSIVFIKPETFQTFIWITTSGSEYEECQLYDISADCDARGILKRVKMLKDYSTEITLAYPKAEYPAKGESEQPDHKKSTPVDVFDLIYNIDTPLTND